MQTMKKYLMIILALAALPLLSACNKNSSTDGFVAQNHDSNAFMTLMHQNMNEMNAMMSSMTMDPDHDFAMMMKKHHQGAVTMSQKELQVGTNATIKQMAQKMIDAQQKEIAQLDSFMAAHTAMMDHEEGMMFMDEAKKDMEKMDMANDLRPLTGNADYDFSQLMIDHHQSAIDMANSILHHGKEAFTKELAKKIIEDQTAEIKQLQDWLLQNKPNGL